MRGIRAARCDSSRTAIVVLLILLLASVTLRYLPFEKSSLPYNIDGLSEYRVVEDIIRTEHLDFMAGASHYDSYVVDMPLLGLLAAFSSSSLGVDPLHLCQVVAGLIGAIAVLLAFVIFREHFLSSRGALCAGVVLATAGSFVFATGCSWKETLGITLIALVVYAFMNRSESRFRAMVVIILPLLVFVHHYSAVVALLILSFWVLIERFSDLRGVHRSNSVSADVPILAMAWTLLGAYYYLIELPYLDYLSPQTDLYLYMAVAALFVLVGIRISKTDRRPSRLPLGLAVPVVGAALMVYNYVDPIFPGIPAPAALIAVPFMAYLLLVVPAWEGARIAFSVTLRSRPMMSALLLAPLSLITFAFLRADDPTSHMIIYRTFDFLMIGFALLVGLGFVHLFKGRPRAGVAGGVCLVIICASTLPIAYNSQELFGVQNHTFDFEYDAVAWFSGHEVDSYSSDQRLGETGWRLFDIDYERGLPYDLREGLSLNASSFFVLEEQWSTNGAQEFPFGVVVVDEGTIDDVLSGTSVFYVGGPTENNIIGFRTL